MIGRFTELIDEMQVYSAYWMDAVASQDPGRVKSLGKTPERGHRRTKSVGGEGPQSGNWSITGYNWSPVKRDPNRSYANHWRNGFRGQLKLNCGFEVSETLFKEIVATQWIKNKAFDGRAQPQEETLAFQGEPSSQGMRIFGDKALHLGANWKLEIACWVMSQGKAKNTANKAAKRAMNLEFKVESTQVMTATSWKQGAKAKTVPCNSDVLNFHIWCR